MGRATTKMINDILASQKKKNELAEKAMALKEEVAKSTKARVEAQKVQQAYLAKIGFKDGVEWETRLKADPLFQKSDALLEKLTGHVTKADEMRRTLTD